MPLIEGFTLSTAVRFLNKEFGIAKTTAKRILRKFRDSGIITAGSKNNPNILIKIKEVIK